MNNVKATQKKRGGVLSLRAWIECIEDLPWHLREGMPITPWGLQRMKRLGAEAEARASAENDECVRASPARWRRFREQERARVEGGADVDGFVVWSCVEVRKF